MRTPALLPNYKFSYCNIVDVKNEVPKILQKITKMILKNDTVIVKCI